MSKETILLVEDDQDLRELIEEILLEEDFEVITAENGKVAIGVIDESDRMIDLVITDIQMPDVKGDKVLDEVRRKRRETPVIVLTAFGSVEQAVVMVRNGAYQYLPKPVSMEDLVSVSREALTATESRRKAARIRRENPNKPRHIVGASRSMKKLFSLINKAGGSKSNVLITGESGTGKELVAKAVHEASTLDGPFVPVNCSAIPSELVESELFGHTGQAFTGAKSAREGLFEAADKGTIFLDEIGELPIAVQPKLLRVLQEGSLRRVGADKENSIDVRVIAATNRDLEVEVEEGRFREDLFWRLNVIHLRVPSLRERVSDIPLLAEHFLTTYESEDNSLDLAPETLAVLTAYPWKGNVRELENTIERAVALAEGATINPDDLPERISASGKTAALISKSTQKQATLAELERAYIIEVMKETGGNKSKSAEILGVDRKTLYRKLDEYANDGFEI